MATDNLNSFLNSQHPKPSDKIDVKCIQVCKYAKSNSGNQADDKSRLPFHADLSLYGFDLVLGDGSAFQAKFQLDPSLEHIVWRGKLQEGCRLRLVREHIDRRLWTSSRSRDGKRKQIDYFHLNDLHILSSTSTSASADESEEDVEMEDAVDPKELPLAWIRDPAVEIGDLHAVEALYGPQPLTGERGCYLPVFADGDPWLSDARWLGSIPVYQHLMPKHRQNIRGLPSLIPHSKRAELEQSASVSVVPENVVLIGRVVQKSSILHFGDTSNLRYPFKFQFELRDDSGSVQCVVWNQLVMKYFRGLKPGDMVAICGFRVKMHALMFETEVTLNPSGPESQMFLLSVDSFQNWSDHKYLSTFPPVLYDYQMDTTVYDKDNGTVVTLVGRVQHLGQILNEFKNGMALQYRYVHIVHSLPKLHFLVKVYSCSQPERFHSLSIGCILRTQVALQSIYSDMCQRSLFYTLTTASSQLTIWDDAILAKKIKANPELSVIPKLSEIPVYSQSTNSRLVMPVVFEDFLHLERSTCKFVKLEFVKVEEHIQMLAVGEAATVVFKASIQKHAEISKRDEVFVAGKSGDELQVKPFNNSTLMLTLQSTNARDKGAIFKCSITPNAAFLPLTSEFSLKEWMSNSIDFIFPKSAESDLTPSETVERWAGRPLIFAVEVVREQELYFQKSIVKVFENSDFSVDKI